jgi:hypothetical protein
MRSTILVLMAAVLPLVWGWGVHWIVERVWPFTEPDGGELPHGVRAEGHPIDYQI